MKTCPVCQAKAFDDASVCYGCMYPFNRKPSFEEGALFGEKTLESTSCSEVASLSAKKEDEITRGDEFKGASVLELKIPLLLQEDASGSLSGNVSTVQPITKQEGWEIKIKVRGIIGNGETPKRMNKKEKKANTQDAIARRDALDLGEEVYV